MTVIVINNVFKIKPFDKDKLSADGNETSTVLMYTINKTIEKCIITGDLIPNIYAWKHSWKTAKIASAT